MSYPDIQGLEIPEFFDRHADVTDLVKRMGL
jgi:hypothetical protein